MKETRPVFWYLIIILQFIYQWMLPHGGWEKKIGGGEEKLGICSENVLKSIENDQKWLKMTLKWPLMTFKWPWDQKQLHHCVRHEKIFKSCRTFCPLTLIVLDLLVKNSDFGGGGPLWATVGPKPEFSQIWLVDLFFKHIKEMKKMSRLARSIDKLKALQSFSKFSSLSPHRVAGPA